MNHNRTIVTRAPEFSGMALGGIGTGTVEIFPTGRLEAWDIFNRGKWASCQAEKHHLEDLPDFQDEPLKFYLRAAEEGEQPVVRKLSMDDLAPYNTSVRLRNFRAGMYSWMKSVEEIAWTADYPVAALEFRDSALPVEVTAEYWSPFLPHRSRISGTPAFCVDYQLANHGDKPVSVSLLGLMKNPICRSVKNRMLRNRIDRDGNSTMLTMTSDSQEKLPENGSISLMAMGGEQSFLRGDFESFLGAYVLGGKLGCVEESCLFGFRETGRLPDLGWETLPDLTGLTIEAAETMEEAQVDAWVELLLQSGSGFDPWKRILSLDPCPAHTLEGKREFLKMMAGIYRVFASDDNPCRSEWGGGGLCSTVTLQPGETETLSFLLGWYFPNHISQNGNFMGHKYSEWFGDSREVCRFLAENKQELGTQVRAFSSLLEDTDCEDAFSRAWSVQLNTIAKCSWWSRAGEFGIWEGYGSCGFHTTDVSYFGSWPLIALFPDLQCRQMQMGAAFQREDGRIPHFFTPDFCSVDNGFDRVDMNPQFVLMVCRDFLWTGDREYLKSLWPNIVRAMENTLLLDTDGDGLPDHDTGANTYDAWKFQGVPVFIAGLWLAALTAGVRLAEEMHEAALAAKWQDILDRGRKNFPMLWNGSYYSLWVDGEKRDECCMSDQLDGLQYTAMLGLQPFLDRESVCRTLDSIVKLNYSRENGLINASYPAGARQTPCTCQNVQATANWTGIEYYFVSFLLEYGRYADALDLADNVERRCWQAGRIFNHEECGDYYYRPLSSWTMLLALSGFRIDAARRHLELALVPQVQELPWFTAGALGKVLRKADRMELNCLDGCLELSSLKAEKGRAVTGLMRNGEQIPFAQQADGTLKGELSLRSGDTLTIFF